MFTVIIVRAGHILQVHLAVPERMVRLQKYAVVERHRQRLVISVNMFTVILARVVRTHILHLVLMERREQFLRYAVVGRHQAHVINVRRIIAHILVRAGHMSPVRLAVTGHRVQHIKPVGAVQHLLRLVMFVKNLRILTVILVAILQVLPEW